MTEHTTRQLPKTDAHFAKGFDEMFFWISVAKDKFNVEQFRLDFGKAPSWSNGISVTPSNPQKAEYFIVASWQIDEKDIDFRIEYRTEASNEADVQKVHAEEFMTVLGKYFKYESASCHVHARFEYPLAERQSAFPLPLKTTLNYEAEIDGIALKLPPKPEGVSRVRLTQGKSMWFVEAISNRRINFKTFSPYQEVNAFSSVIDKLLEERTS